MTLTSGRFVRDEYVQMIVRFSMRDDAEIPCVTSTSAMHCLEPAREHFAQHNLEQICLCFRIPNDVPGAVAMSEARPVEHDHPVIFSRAINQATRPEILDPLPWKRTRGRPLPRST